MLIIDQFEEVIDSDVAEDRVRYLEAIDRLLANGEMRLIVTVRLDVLYERPADDLLEALVSDPVFLRPLSRVAVRRAIEGPAGRAGYAFEPGLVDRIVDDVDPSPAGAVLLQLALRQLWERRQDG